MQPERAARDTRVHTPPRAWIKGSGADEALRLVLLPLRRSAAEIAATHFLPHPGPLPYLLHPDAHTPEQQQPQPVLQTALTPPSTVSNPPTLHSATTMMHLSTPPRLGAAAQRGCARPTPAPRCSAAPRDVSSRAGPEVGAHRAPLPRDGRLD